MTDHQVPSANQSLLSGFDPVGEEGPPANEGPWYWPAGATSAAAAWATWSPRGVATATPASARRRKPVGTRENILLRLLLEREDSDTCGRGMLSRGVVGCQGAPARLANFLHSNHH